MWHKAEIDIFSGISESQQLKWKQRLDLGLGMDLSGSDFPKSKRCPRVHNSSTDTHQALCWAHNMQYLPGLSTLLCRVPILQKARLTELIWLYSFLHVTWILRGRASLWTQILLWFYQNASILMYSPLIFSKLLNVCNCHFDPVLEISICPPKDPSCSFEFNLHSHL